jgi:hypothetical protein
MGKPSYTPQPARVTKFFATIQDVVTPWKVTGKYLKTIGFKSGNDYYLIGILKSLNFIDQAGVPTETWNAYKNKHKAKEVMASSIKSGYDDLFGTYEDADKRDKEIIENYFSSKWGVSTTVAHLMSETFRRLCDLANLEAATEPVITLPSAKKLGERPGGVVPLTININIQLQLPATENATIYESLFSALKKHLFS